MSSFTLRKPKRYIEANQVQGHRIHSGSDVGSNVQIEGSMSDITADG